MHERVCDTRSDVGDVVGARSDVGAPTTYSSTCTVMHT